MIIGGVMILSCTSTLQQLNQFKINSKHYVQSQLQCITDVSPVFIIILLATSELFCFYLNSERTTNTLEYFEVR